MPDISIIVPALNEEGNLPPLVESLLQQARQDSLDVEILVVDDCSDDGTYVEGLSLMEKYPNFRIHHKELPRGFGNAIRAGIEQGKGLMGVIVCADNVDPLEILADMKKKIVDEGYDLVLASRRLAKSDTDYMPFKYKFFQFGYRWLSRLLIGFPFKDGTYSYRAFNLPLVKRLGLESPGFEISPEISFKIFLAGGRITELRASPRVRKIGKSKFSFFGAGQGYPRVLWQAFLLRLSRRSPKTEKSQASKIAFPR
jgi:dolichol-phosphate mannosyltransferase